MYFVVGLRAAGIYAMARGNNFLSIQTLYEDSSYAMLKEANKDFVDEYYSDVSTSKNILGYCLGYYYFDNAGVIVSEIENSTNRKVFKINDSLYYYRTPIFDRK